LSACRPKWAVGGTDPSSQTPVLIVYLYDKYKKQSNASLSGTDIAYKLLNRRKITAKQERMSILAPDLKKVRARRASSLPANMRGSGVAFLQSQPCSLKGCGIAASWAGKQFSGRCPEKWIDPRSVDKNRHPHDSPALPA
jgi:hypothetical protein